MFAVGGAPGAQWQQAMLKGPEAAAGVAEGGVHTPNTASPVRRGWCVGRDLNCPSGWDSCVTVVETAGRC